ncbi:hypothetical protein K435DRAFT_809401 [Dendrothele bispora CBS 962.96]|uniref:Uncharacterized protein n=1 Tax=Dendrothele bispora (strain CBS 962.96) TaxID=1314807 RepID=A0A4S8KYL0_DENBC|nr:hypothetical protein K435DRAFT_809401 [Dendrothele bispora CBS 962.96]
MSADHIPALPSATAGQGSWPPNVHQAYQALSNIYLSAVQALQSDSEASRLSFHLETIIKDALPLLLAFEEGIDNFPSLMPWLEATVKTFSDLLDDFCVVGDRMQGQDSDVHIEPGIHIERTGTPGRPRKFPDPEILIEAFASHRGISQQSMADHLGIHRSTLDRYMKAYNITSHQYSDISNADLDKIVKAYRTQRPQSGVRYLRGHLRTEHNLRVQKRRVKDSVDRVDPLGRVLRQYTTTHRWQYKNGRCSACKY